MRNHLKKKQKESHALMDMSAVRICTRLFSPKTRPSPEEEDDDAALQGARRHLFGALAQAVATGVRLVDLGM